MTSSSKHASHISRMVNCCARALRSLGTGRALWFGFGVLMVLLLSLGVVASVKLRTISREVNGMASVAWPRSAAARELEINVVGYALEVRVALTGDARVRASAEEDAEEIALHLAEYEQLAVTPRQRELAARFRGIWKELYALGESLLAAGRASPEELARLTALRVALEQLLNEEMQVEAVEAFDTSTAATLDNLAATENLTLLLLVAGLFVAMLTSGGVARVVLGNERILRRHAALLELSDEPILVWEPEDGITFWNRGAERIYGFPPAEALGRSPHELLRTASPWSAETILETLESQGHWEGELEHHTRDRRTIIVDSRMARVTEPGGRRAVLEVNRDVTARQKAETELRESEARYRTLFTSIDEGFCVIELIFDADGKAVDYRFIEINPAFERHTGIHDAAGRTMREFAPAHEEHWFEIYGRVATSRETVRFESEAKQLHRWFDVRASPYGAPGSRRVAVLFSDITERKQAEINLRESERRLSTLVANLPGIAYRCLITPSWPMTFMSARALDLTGYRAQDFLSGHMSYGEIIHPEDQLMVWEIVDAGVKARQPFTVEYRIRHADGSERWVWEQGRGVFDEASEAIALEGFILDTTERRQAEEALRRLTLELEQRVAQRTADLETANRELEAFSYSVSHDLRAPLRAVSGFATIFEEDYGAQLPADGREVLGKIQEGARKMAALINDLLHFSRTTRQPLESRQVDLTHVAEECYAELAPQREGREIEFSITPLPPVWGDPALLRQALLNLLGNAIKYTRDRSPARIEFSSEQRDGETVYFVKDNGAGFDMRYADKLFGVFQRLHSATEYEGTGVGLAIVARIIHRHGGRVWAEAEVDRGATFFFTLGTGAGG